VYFTGKQNAKLVADKCRFKSGWLHEKHGVATWKLGSHLSICLEPSQHLLIFWLLLYLILSLFCSDVPSVFVAINGKCPFFSCDV